MRISVEAPSKLTSEDERIINRLASAGFGQNESEMLHDTLAHIHTADLVQRAYDNKGMIGFALYRRQLWR